MVGLLPVVENTALGVNCVSGGGGTDPRAGRLSRSVGGGLQLKQAIGVLQSGGQVLFGMVQIHLLHFLYHIYEEYVEVVDCFVRTYD